MRLGRADRSSGTQEVCATGLLVGKQSGRGWILLRSAEQDRMNPLCLDQQLAIDAEQRRGLAANRVDHSSRLRNISE